MTEPVLCVVVDWSSRQYCSKSGRKHVRTQKYKLVNDKFFLDLNLVYAQLKDSEGYSYPNCTLEERPSESCQSFVIIKLTHVCLQSVLKNHLLALLDTYC
jgi:hypothetical protein